MGYHSALPLSFFLVGGLALNKNKVSALLALAGSFEDSPTTVRGCFQSNIFGLSEDAFSLIHLTPSDEL